MSKMFDCPHCGVTTAIPEGMYLDSDDCDSCGRNYWETPLIEEEEEMPEDNLEGLGQSTVLKKIAERFEEYDQMSDREIQELLLDFTQTTASEMNLLVVMVKCLLDATLAQMNDHQLVRFQKMTSERQVKSNFDNLPTTKEN